MNANTNIGWEPSAAEAQYLFERVMGHSNLFTTTGDMPICIRIMGEFRTRFAATHREPPMEYVLNLLREYKSSLFTAPSGVNPNFGPNHDGSQFVNGSLHRPELDFSFFQDYNAQNQPLFGNHPLELNLHSADYAGYLGIDMQYPNTPAQPDVCNNDPTMDLQINAPTADLPIDALTADRDTASVDKHSESVVEPLGNDAKVGSIAKTSHKKKGERNVFYGSKVTAAILYAKQDNQINALVDATLERQPELQRERVRILAEERSKAWKNLSLEDQAHWNTEADKINNQCPDLGSVKEKLKLLTSRLLPLQNHALEALSFPIASIAFTPPSGMEPAKANIIYTGDEDQQNFTDWLGDTYGDETLAQFMDHLDAFAKVVHKSAANKVVHISEDKYSAGRSVGRSVSKKEDPLGAYWSGKLSMVPDPSGLSIPDLRRVFRAALVERWNECGYTGKAMPWLRIRDIPSNFIQPEFLGEEGIKEPEGYHVDILRRKIRIFVDHQEGKLPYNRGLIFLPCGTGSELYCPTKKVKGKGRARAKAMTPAFDAATTPAFDAATTPAFDAATPSADITAPDVPAAPPTEVPTTVSTKSSEATTSPPAALAPVAAEGPAIAAPVPTPVTASSTAISITNANAAPTANAPTNSDSATTDSTPTTAIAAEDATAAATAMGASAVHNGVMPPSTTTTAPLTTSPSTVTAGAHTLKMPPHRSVLAIMHEVPDVPPTNVSVTQTTKVPTALSAEVPAKVTSIPDSITINPPATASTPTSITTASTTTVTTTGSNTGVGLVAPSIKVPATLLKEKARRRKKGGEPVDGSMGPPVPTVPTRTLRGTAKRNAEQAALEDSGSSTSTRPKKSQRSE